MFGSLAQKRKEKIKKDTRYLYMDFTFGILNRKKFEEKFHSII
ncbi:hypothetical protein LEP1GSC175_2418 [Leptospira santarosai str. HAI821]|nr:hypothetical protein LEP1GSC163_3013 [Leptospira santarosai str. CBC379]EMO33583.1 hypothetical protein LEP1GSC175_2418 [Leptospira santarosai str. HAI821]